MRLSELDGRLYRLDVEKHENLPVDTVAEADVLYFQCPKCAEGLPRGTEGGRRFAEGAHYISVPFAAHDGRSAMPQSDGHQRPRWGVTGSTLEDVSTTPSILVIGGCTWHGYVTNGETRSC